MTVDNRPKRQKGKRGGYRSAASYLASTPDEQIEQMQEYALAGCQNNTIATKINIPIETLTRRFGKLLTKKRAERKYNILNFFFRVYTEICGLYKTRFLEAYTHISIRNRPCSPSFRLASTPELWACTHVWAHGCKNIS